MQYTDTLILGPFYGAIAVPSVTRCRCRHRCATVATPGEWQCGVRRLAVANGPNIFQMLLVDTQYLQHIALKALPNYHQQCIT